MASGEWLAYVRTGGQEIVAGEGKVKHFKQLLVWQKAMALAKEIYRLTARFPADERFGLVSQMRRAAISVPSNIAEGQARHSTREFLQFLSHAGGSLAEVETQLLLSIELGHCKELETVVAAGLIEELQKMLPALRRKLAESASH